MRIGDKIMVVNEVSGLFGKTGRIVQHPFGRLFKRDGKRVFVKIGETILSMGKFEVAKTWNS